MFWLNQTRKVGHAVILIVVCLFIISFVKKDNIKISNNETAMDTIKSYLALGDSFTIGESVVDADRFPVQTVELLKKQGIPFNEPEIIATTGWTTGDLISAIHNHSPAKNTYSAVTLLIGVNNQYRGTTIEEYKTEFAQLLNMAIVYAGNIKNHVFVLSIPDYSVTPFASGSDTAKIAREIDDFNAVNKSISLRAGVHYLDITPISRDAKTDPSLTAGDGLHPSAIQYKKWSELLASMMLKEFH